MAKAKLTIEKVKELAMQNYEKGGDIIVECCTDDEIEDLINNGIDTKKKLLKFFKDGYEVDEEYRKAALWAGYGTTDEEEIARMQLSETETEDYIEEDHYDYESDFTDPCFGCMARDNSYNCKHCPHGDDGRYESPFDVYTPSELGLNVK